MQRKSDCASTPAKLRFKELETGIATQHQWQLIYLGKYLGSCQTSDSNIKVNLKSRIGKGSAVFKQLQTVWLSKSFTIKTKLRLFMSIVVSTTTYASDTWKSTTKSLQQLNFFQQRFLKNIMNIKWQDRVTNKVLRLAGMIPVNKLISDRRVQLLGHTMRLPITKPAIKALEWTSDGGKRPRGWPKKTWPSDETAKYKTCNKSTPMNPRWWKTTKRTTKENLVFNCKKRSSWTWNQLVSSLQKCRKSQKLEKRCDPLLFYDWRIQVTRQTTCLYHIKLF